MLGEVAVTVALVIGGAKGVWDEVGRAYSEFDINVVVAVNMAIVNAVRVDVAVSLHPSKLEGWLNERELTPIERVVSFKDHRGQEKYPVTDVVKFLWPGMLKSGSSGLYAAKVAMELLGADKVILAGVPMDGGPHYYDDKPWGIPKDFREGWVQASPHIIGKVKSYGGWTRDLLGEPTQEWANS